MLGAERGRVAEEEADVGELGEEAREEGGEGLGVGREVDMASTLIVIEIADLAEFEFFLLHLLLLHLRRRLPDLLRSGRVSAVTQRRWTGFGFYLFIYNWRTSSVVLISDKIMMVRSDSLKMTDHNVFKINNVKFHYANRKLD